MDELFVFMLGAAGYSIIEILWRGYTHWTMSLTGGLCLMMIYYLNLRFEAGLLVKCTVFTILITLTEFLVGVVVNIVLGWGVWDYSELPFNFKGQICALYSMLWFFLCFPIVKFCNYLRYVIERF